MPHWPSETDLSSSGIEPNSDRHSRTKSEFTVSNDSTSTRAWADIVSDLSLEFLMGRALDNAMLNVGLKDVARGNEVD